MRAFTLKLPVVVSGSACRWRSLLSFSLWAGEAVAAGVSPQSATISCFELEVLLLIVLDFQSTAEDQSPLDTGPKLHFVDRALRMLAVADIVTRPLADEAAFYGRAFPYVQGLIPPANVFLQAVPSQTAMVTFVPRHVPCAHDLAWLESLTWKKLKSSRGSYAESHWFLRLHGHRAAELLREDTIKRLSLVAAQDRSRSSRGRACTQCTPPCRSLVMILIYS